jgi:hypothetical protein
MARAMGLTDGAEHSHCDDGGVTGCAEALPDVVVRASGASCSCFKNPSHPCWNLLFVVILMSGVWRHIGRRANASAAAAIPSART